MILVIILHRLQQHRLALIQLIKSLPLALSPPVIAEPAARIELEDLLAGQALVTEDKNAVMPERSKLTQQPWQLSYGSNTHSSTYRNKVVNRGPQHLTLSVSDLDDPHVIDIDVDGQKTLGLIQGNTLRFTLRRDNGRMRYRYRAVVSPDGNVLQGNLSVQRHGKTMRVHPWVGRSASS